MFPLILKVLISAIIIVVISELAKKNALIAGLTASLPLVSIFAMIWLYRDEADLTKVTDLSKSVFWMVIPSLLFFVLFPVLVKYGMKFYAAMATSCGITAVVYYFYVKILTHFGIVDSL
jgi:uncharacterized membrane protein